MEYRENFVNKKFHCINIRPVFKAADKQYIFSFLIFLCYCLCIKAKKVNSELMQNIRELLLKDN